MLNNDEHLNIAVSIYCFEEINLLQINFLTIFTITKSDCICQKKKIDQQ